MARGDVERKFRGNVGEHWTKPQIEANLKSLWALDDVSDLAVLLGNLAVT